MANPTPDLQALITRINAQVAQTFAENRAKYAGFKMELEGDQPAGEDADQVSESVDEQNEPDPDEQADANDDDENSGLDLEAAQKALKKVRTSEAKYRTRLRELEKKFEGAQTPEEVQKIIAEHKESVATESRALLVENVALRHGLPDDLAAVLKGDTREELDAHAKTLKKYAPAEDDDPELEGGLNPRSADGGGSDVKSLISKARTNRY